MYYELIGGRSGGYSAKMKTLIVYDQSIYPFALLLLSYKSHASEMTSHNVRQRRACGSFKSLGSRSGCRKKRILRTARLTTSYPPDCRACLEKGWNLVAKYECESTKANTVELSSVPSNSTIDLVVEKAGGCLAHACSTARTRSFGLDCGLDVADAGCGVQLVLVVGCGASYIGCCCCCACRCCGAGCCLANDDDEDGAPEGVAVAGPAK